MFFELPSFWRYSGWFFAILLSVWLFQWRGRFVPVKSEQFSGKLEFYTAIILICVGLFLRFAYLDEFLGGKLTSDENLLTVIYLSTVVHGEPSVHGATHLACALTLDLWYQLFGFTPYTARAYAATMGAIGLLGLYLGILGALGKRTALWGTAFLSVSLFGIYFSKVAFDVGWVTMVYPVTFALIVWSLRKRSYLLAACAGLFASFGVFSYPGIILAAFAILLGLAATYTFKLKSAATKPMCRVHAKLYATMALSAIPFAIYAVAKHKMVLGAGGQPLLMGGGGLSLTWKAYADGILQVLRDSFIDADSWYLQFREMPFFEFALMPLAALGLMRFFRDRMTRPWFAAFYAVPILMLLVPMSGAYPGMRRAIYAVIPYSIAVAGGLMVVIESTCKHGMVFRVLTLIIVGLSVLHPLIYQFTLGRAQVKWNIGEGFSRPRIPTDFLLSTLKTKDVILERNEFDSYFDARIYHNYPRLYARYQKDSGVSHEVMLIGQPTTDASPDEFSQQAGKVFMTWDNYKVTQLIKNGKLCVPSQAMDVSSNLQPYWGVVAGPNNNCGAIPALILPAMGSSLSMHFDKVARLVHELHCTAEYCGADRPEFIYAAGGDVSFLLQPKNDEIPSMLTVEINESNTPGRENAVLVNNVPIGLISIGTLDATKQFARIPIPVAARLSNGPWTVKLLAPPAGKPGWDVRNVAIGTGELPPIDSSFSLRYDKMARMIHELHCPADYCGPNRPDFLYAFGGEVSFLLQPHGKELPNMLKVEVGEYKTPGRENAVLVNDIPIGQISLNTLDSTEHFAILSIPVAARQLGRPWKIRLLAPPDGKPGWDILHVELGTIK
jgi:hypothetical protein